MLANLPQRFLEIANALKLHEEFDIRTAKPSGGRLQRYLLNCLWESGTSSDTHRNEKAIKALRIISAIYTTGSYNGVPRNSESNVWSKYEVCFLS